MKPTTPLFLISSFLFLSATFAAAAAASDSVLDSDGNALKRGTEYHILPNPGIGGGLTLAARNGTCPLYVAKESSETSPGLPVVFFPYDNDRTVRLATDANFVFNASTICVQSTVWRLGAFEEATGRTFVGISGVVGKTGVEARSNWFRIEKFEEEGRGYKLAYCPQPPVCRNCGKPRCGDLGLFTEDGKVFLGLGGSPFPVLFKKA